MNKYAWKPDSLPVNIERDIRRAPDLERPSRMIREIDLPGFNPNDPTEIFQAPFTSRADVLGILYYVRRYRPKRFLEVGTNRGATTLAIAERFPEMQIVTIDPGDQVPVEKRLPVQRDEYLPQSRIGELCRHLPNVQIIRAAFESIAWDSEQRFDMIFIDGDHSRDVAERDSLLGQMLLTNPGVILWHDFPNTLVGVKQALEVLPFADKITSVRNTWLAVYDTHDGAL